MLHVKNTFRLLMIVLCYAALWVVNERTTGIGLSLVVMVVQGFILAGSINLAHECIHGHFYESRKLTNVVGEVSAALHLISFRRYKEDHLLHHRYVGTSRDTEDSSSFDTLAQYLAAMLSMGFLRKGVGKIYEEFRKLCLAGEMTQFMRRNWPPLVFFLGAAVLMLFHTETILRNYLVPIAFANFWIFFFGLPEHYDCSLGKDWKENVRSTSSNFFVQFFQWGANWHAHHHRFPGTPSPQFAWKHPELKMHLKHQESSYTLWHIRLIRKLISQ